MYVLNFSVLIDNPLTLGKLHYHQSCGSKKPFRKGDIIKVWNADRSGYVEAKIHSVNGTNRSPDTWLWQLVEE